MPPGISFGAGTLYVSALPTHNPGSDGARRAINTATGEKYRWVSGTTWEIEPGGEYQESVTYAELTAKIGASTLIPGLQYLISDFRSAWYHTDNGVPINSPQYATVEPIVVTAIASNKIASLAYSTLHPSDVLYYDWDAANWTADAFYSIGGTIIPDWRGVITRRIDTVNNTNCTFDSRAVTFRRFAVNASIYNAGATYNRGDFVFFGARRNCFLCIQDGTTGVSPTSDYSKWCKIVDGENMLQRPHYLFSSAGHPFEFPVGDDFWEFTIPAGASSDFPAFPNGSKNITIEGPSGYSAANIVLLTQSTGFSASLVRDSTIGNSADGAIGPECSTIFCRRILNSVLPGYSEKIIMGEVRARFSAGINMVVLPNTAGDFGALYRVAVSDILSSVFITSAQNCFFERATLSTIGDGCQSNIFKILINSQIGDAFYLNVSNGTISDTQIGNRAESNTFNADVAQCSIGNEFQGNVFNDVVSRSEFSDGYIGNTHNGGTYNCKIGRDSTGNTWPGMTGVTLGDSAQNNAQSSTSGAWNFVEAGGGFQGNDLGTLTRCRFGNLFALNIGDFEDCNLDSNFGRNTFSGLVKKLNGGAGFQNGDYTLGATIVYNNASKTFILNENEDKLIQYIDGANALVIANHDA